MDNDAVPAGAARSGDAALLRGIGFWALVASIINNTIGSGIFSLPGDLAKAMGPAAPWAFVLGAMVFVPITMCFSAAGSRVHATGGPYSYVTVAFGEFAGFLVAAVLWISNAAAAGGIAAALADALGGLSPSLKSPIARASFVLVPYLFLCVLNARGVRSGARAVMFFAVTKLLPLVLLATLGLLYVHAGNLHVQKMPGADAIGGSMVLVIFAYSGIESALLPSGEIKDPSSVVPRAAMTAIGAVVLLYIALQVVAQGVLGAKLAGATEPLGETAGAIFPWLSGAMLLTASISRFGYLQNDLLGSSRLLFALGRDGYLPSPLARVTRDHHVPLLAIIAHGAFSAGLALMGNFNSLALLSGGSICLVYLGVCAAAWWLQRRGVRGEGAPFVLRGGPIVPLIGVAGLGLVLSTLQPKEWLAIAYAMVAVLVIYGVARLLRRTAR